MAEHQVKKTRIHLIQDGLSPWLYFIQREGRQGNGRASFFPLKTPPRKRTYQFHLCPIVQNLVSWLPQGRLETLVFILDNPTIVQGISFDNDKDQKTKRTATVTKGKRD